MKNLVAAVHVAVLALTVASADAQTLESDRIFPAEARRAADVRAARTAGDVPGALLASAIADEGKQKNVLVLLPTVPATFNSLQKDSMGEWQFGAAMTLGVGATFVLGKATFNGQTANVDPWMIAGAAINAGVRESGDKEVGEALTISGFLGFGDVALNFSRGLLGGGTSVGLSLKLDVITNLAPDAYMCIRGCR